MGRSQGKTRTPEGQEQGKDRGARQEEMGQQWFWMRWEGRCRCSRGWDMGRQSIHCILGRIFFILSYNYNTLLATDPLWTPSPQLSPILWGSPEGNCTALEHQWGYHKTQINSQGVFPLLGKGRGCVSAFTSRILQINHAMPRNLCRMKRSWIKLSMGGTCSPLYYQYPFQQGHW